MEPKTCPLCNGTGETEDQKPTHISGIVKSHPCHGCDGKGWVEVSSDSEKPIEGKKSKTFRPFPMY